MKNSIIILYIIVFFTSCKKPSNTFIIDATITGIQDSTKVYLFNINTFNNLDSTIIVNDQFTFKGKLDNPINVAVSISDVSIGFWLENKKIKINASKKQLLKKDTDLNKVVTGSETNIIALRYKELMKPVNKRRSEMYKRFIEKVISEKTFQKYLDSIAKVSIQFFLENPNNYFSLSRIFDLKSELKRERLGAYFSQLPSELKNSSYGKLLDDFLHIKPLKEGDYFVDIVAKNLQGETIKLSDFKGKTILLDFWAGWCPPCIKQIKEEFPSIIEKYKDKNFQIVSFSFDFDRKMWENASDQLKIDWPDFSNLIRMNNNSVALHYGITQIPTSFIISEEGKILKRVEYEDDLEKELDKVLLDK